MAFLYLYFILAACVALMAMIRGRSGLRWFVLGVFATPLIAGLFVVALPPVENFELLHEHGHAPIREMPSRADSKTVDNAASIAHFLYLGTSTLAVLILAFAAINYIANVSADVHRFPIVPLVIAGLLWLLGRSFRISHLI